MLVDHLYIFREIFNQVFWLLFNWTFCFCVVRALCIFWKLDTSDIWFKNILLYYFFVLCCCFFTFSTVLLDVSQIFGEVWWNTIYLFFLLLLLLLLLHLRRSWRFTDMLYSKTFIVLALTLIHVEWSFLYDLR